MNKSIIVSLALVALVLVQANAEEVVIRARLDRERSDFALLDDGYNPGFVEVKIDPKYTITALAMEACYNIKGIVPMKAELRREGSDVYLSKELTGAGSGLKNGDRVVVDCYFEYT